MLLSDGRAAVRLLIDDLLGNLATDAQVDSALTTGQYEAALFCVSSGSTIMLQEATITTGSTGLADLSSIRPLKIHNVAISVGGYRSRIDPINVQDISSLYQGAQTITVAYTPRPTFPSGPTQPFVWGNAAVSLPPLDEYMCCVAASQIKATDGEVNPIIEQRKAELLKQVMGLINNPSWVVSGMGRTRNYSMGIQWAVTLFDTLQLCY